MRTPGFSFLLALLVGVSGFAEGVTPAQVAASRKKLEQVGETVEEARELLPLEDLDLEERAMALELDATRIIEWVRRSIAFDVYPGVLRGPRGTLLGRAGNAWDQAVLTAALLRRGGYQVVVARGKLGDTEAVALLNELGHKAKASSTETDDEGLEEVSARLAELAGRSEAEASKAREEMEAREKARRDKLEAQVGEETDALREALSRTGVTLAADRRAWVEEIRDYAWVRHRRAAGEEWSDAHPAFAEVPQALADLEPEELFTEALPEELLHRVELGAWIETFEKGKLRSQPVMNSWVRPVANLVGEPISLTFSADGFKKITDGRDPATAYARTNWFYPQLGSSMAPGAKAFDLRGFRVNPDAAADPMGQIFSRTGDRVLGALDSLDVGTGGKQGPARELTAVWLELKLHRPGAKPVVHRRWVLDRLGPDARARKLAPAPMERATLAARIHSQHELVVLPGEISPYLWVDRKLAYQGRVLEMLDGAVAKLATPKAPQSLPGSLGRLKDPGTLGQILGVGRSPAGEGLRVFRSGPGIYLVHKRILPEGGKIRQQIDIVQAPRRAISYTPTGWAPAPEAALKAGVRETVAEANRPLARSAEAGGSAIGRLGGAGEELVLVKETGDPALAGLGLGPRARARLERDLWHGYLALVRKGEDPAWWRIHPRRGEAIGVTADGAGSATVDYVNLTSAIVNGLFTGYGMSQCETVCCALTTAAMGVGLGAAGFAIGADLTGKAAWAFMAIMDIGVNTATTVIVPSPCNG